jgi:hypothetical protein
VDLRLKDTVRGILFVFWSYVFLKYGLYAAYGDGYSIVLVSTSVFSTNKLLIDGSQHEENKVNKKLLYILSCINVMVFGTISVAGILIYIYEEFV